MRDSTHELPKTAVITGGSHGIGKAIADELLADDFVVVIADLVPPTNPGTAYFKTCDVTCAEDVAGLHGYVMEKVGPPRVLICNAGRGIHEPLSSGDPDKWQQVFDLNVMGNLRFIRSFLPAMLEADGSHLVFITSVAAKKTYAGGGIYAASKAALEMIAETLRIELSGRARISVVAPGKVRTDFYRHSLSPEGFGEADLSDGMEADVVGQVVRQLLRQGPNCNLDHVTMRPVDQLF